MTLIITVLADDAVVQVSDRRLTSGGSIVPKPENKALCVSCSDANFTVSFTGLARIHGMPTTDWTLGQLTCMKAGALDFPTILGQLRDKLTAAWAGLSVHGRTAGITFAFAGFGRAGPFYGLLSNIEDAKGTRLPTVNAAFQSGIWLRNKKRLRKLDIVVNGAEEAVVGTIDAAIPAVRRRFLRHTADKRAEMLVELVRRAADHPTIGKYIGKECMSVVVPASGDFITRYHPVAAEAVHYAPHLLTTAMAFKDVRYSLPPGFSVKFGGK